jgi:lipopolysaccharide transport system permease protein
VRGSSLLNHNVGGHDKLVYRLESVNFLRRLAVRLGKLLINDALRMPLPIRQYLTLMDTLARFQLKAEARRFVLGYLWWIVEPLLYVAVFYVVFVKLMGNRQADFLVFLAIGKLTFIWFSKSINQAAMSLVNNRGLIGQVNLPKHLFPLSIVQEGLYRQLAVFAFLILFVIGSGYSPQLNWFWLLPIAALQYLLIVACGSLVAVLVCLRRDFQMLIQLGTLFLLFMSGVFWDVRALEDAELAGWLMALNPLVVLLDAYRQVLMHGEGPNMARLGWVLVEAMVLLISTMWLYRRLNFWLAQRAVTQ